MVRTSRLWRVMSAPAVGLSIALMANAWCLAGARARPAAAVLGPSTVHARLQLARLSGLRNYTFTSVSSNGRYSFTVTGKVHDPRDWEAHSTAPAVTTYDVGGHGYALAVGQVVHVTFKTPEGVNHLDGEQVFAEQLVGYTHVLGIRITTAGPCKVAAARGTIYRVQSPDARTLSETATACVANSSGALLAYASGVAGGSAAKAAHLTGLRTTFKVTSIGGVAPIGPPKKPPAPPSVPSAPGRVQGPAGLPSGFPSEVPAPPGKIMTGVKLGTAKWYLQVTETSPAAFGLYTRTLKQRGFVLTTVSKTAAADIEILAHGPLQVELEQMSLPGQGVILTVIVSRSG